MDIRAILRDRGRETMRDLERARREFLREHRGQLVIRTETVVLSMPAAREPETVDRAREHLVDRLTVWADRTGHTVVEILWETDPPDDRRLVMFRLEARCVERTDGEWPSVHQARREDEADRAAAKETADDVNGRLDALRAGARYWASRDLRGGWRPSGGPPAR